MPCVVCGGDLWTASPAPYCSESCAERDRQAQPPQGLDEESRELLRQEARHAAYCARRTNPDVPCTCALAKYT